MESSPPVRAWGRVPSPNGSNYSIDLDALEPESRSGASTPLPTQHVDQVLSEEIDGPSDFTQNMEAWMKGGTMKKGTLKSLKEEDFHDGFVQRLTTPRKDNGFANEETAVSRHTPTDSPPKESILRERNLGVDEEYEEGSSEWDPYVENQTPHPNTSKQQYLRPTVEEYYSELTPGNVPSIRKSRSIDRGSQHQVVEHDSPIRSRSSSGGRPSSPTLSPERSPVLQRAVPHQSNPQTEEATLQEQLEDLQTKCQRLEHLNQALNKAVEEERRLRKEQNNAHDGQLAEISRREQDLTEMKDQAYVHKEDFRREFGDLKARSQQHEAQQDASRKEIERLKSEHAAELHKMAEQMQRDQSDYSQEIRALEQDVELARRSRDDAEETAKSLREELEEYQDGHDVELDRMKLELQQVDDSKGQISELEERLKSAKAENEKLLFAKNTAEQATINARAELSVLKQTQDGETARLASDHLRAVNLAEDLQSKLKELRQQLQDEQGAHEADIARLQSEQSQPDSASEDIQALLNTAILERDDAQDELAALKQDLEDAAAVNRALDARISDAIGTREAYWRNRLQDAEEERRLMSKALMRQWGREEVGIEEPLQSYEYMFVTKDMKTGA